MANCVWAVTKDHLVEEAKPVIFGNLSLEEILRHPLVEHFRMHDDDGNLYYEGVYIALNDEITGFEPLDNYGRPYAGCSRIYYLENAQWSML